jgi:KaiC/GvpD/RAD55 family RecA-like ATPase
MADLGVDAKMPILKKNRLTSGVADLDLILEGGYRSPANLILIGPSGMEKAAFSYHFAAAAKAETAFIICGNASPKDIISKAGTMGIDLSKTHFIDCYSATLGKVPQPEEGNITIVDGPSALNDISLALNEAIKKSAGKRMRVVFDTLSTFVLYNSKDSMRKFLSVIAGRLKSANATTLYLIDEGVHDRQMLSLLEAGMDDKFELSDKGGKFVLKVPDVDMEIPVRVGPTGISII